MCKGGGAGLWMLMCKLLTASTHSWASHRRAARSAHAFAQGLFSAHRIRPEECHNGDSGIEEGSPPPALSRPIHIVTPDCLRVAAGNGGLTKDGQGEKGGAGWEVDRLTRFFDVCPLYTASKKQMARERAAFLESEEMGQVLARVKGRLPRVHLTREDLSALYTLCGFEVAHLNRTSGACSLFGSEDADALEYLEDLKHWYKKSYGLPLNAHMACPLHRSLLEALRLRALGSSNRSAEMIFAHGETLLPLLTRLGLFADPPSRALTATLSKSQRQARAFRSTAVNPMAANFAFVLYDCGARGSAQPAHRHLVLALHNERAIMLPFCAGNLFCPLEDVVADLEQGSSCDFEKVCGYNESDPMGDRGSGRPDGRAWPTALDTLIVGGAAQISAQALAMALLAAVVSLAVLALLACSLAQRVSATEPLKRFSESGIRSQRAE